MVVFFIFLVANIGGALIFGRSRDETPAAADGARVPVGRMVNLGSVAKPTRLASGGRAPPPSDPFA